MKNVSRMSVDARRKKLSRESFLNVKKNIRRLEWCALLAKTRAGDCNSKEPQQINATRCKTVIELTVCSVVSR